MSSFLIVNPCIRLSIVLWKNSNDTSLEPPRYRIVPIYSAWVPSANWDIKVLCSSVTGSFAEKLAIQKLEQSHDGEMGSWYSISFETIGTTVQNVAADGLVLQAGEGCIIIIRRVIGLVKICDGHLY